MDSSNNLYLGNETLVVIDHIAIAVPNLETAIPIWQKLLGIPPSSRGLHETEGVSCCFFQLANVKIELMEPARQSSTISQFLERNPRGGIHHIAIAGIDFNIQGIRRLRMVKESLVDGKDAIFLHPKDLSGCLIEVVNNALD